jgi:gas vesicle protein
VGATETELRREADIQRARMGETLEAIGDRLSPPRMVERRKAAVGQTFRNMKERVMGSPDYEEPMSQRLSDRAGDAMETAGDTLQAAKDNVQHAPEAIADQTRGNPIAAGIVAFGAGMLLATVFPESSTEQRLVGQAQPQLHHAAEQAKEMGRGVASDARDEAQRAGDAVKAKGSDATQNVRDQAKSSTEEIRRTAQNR